MIACHVIFGAYGFWLPNDPRGSWSDAVWSKPLYAVGGPVRKVETRQSVARISHDSQKRLETKSALKYPAVYFDETQIRSVGAGFATAVGETDLRVFACAIMPEHVHLVFEKHERETGSLVGQLKSRATKQLNADKIHPLQGKSTPWSEGFWTVFLDHQEDVVRAVEYVRLNPVREGRDPQDWSFVVPFC